MILHKILRGDQAGLYLPFGLSRLKALAAIYGTTGFFQEKYYPPGGYTVEVAQAPPFQYVRITQGGGLFYEFFTSEHVNNSSLGTPGFIGDITDTYVQGSAVRTTFTKGAEKSRGVYSNVFAPAPGDVWKLRDTTAPPGTDSGLFTWPAWQNQKFFEHRWHPNNDGKSLVTSTQAQAPGLAGQCNWMSPYAFARVAGVGSKVSDFGLDVLPTYYSGSAAMRGAPALENPWLYWRHAAVQSVDGKLFFISTDNYGRFQVYPVSDYRDTAGVVPPGGYRTYTPPYPAWVTVPDAGNYLWQVNDWLWRFNKDATKCVSIPYHSDFSNGFYKTLADEAFFATLTPTQVSHGDPAYANAILPAHEDTPGLVEFGIQIVITGPNPMDFMVNFTLLRNSYFGDSGRFFFDAAYFLKDVETIGVAEDTLVTAEVECKYPAGYLVPASMDGYYIDQAPNVQGFITINTNDAFLAKTEKLRFNSFPGGNGQFLTLAGANAGEPRGSIGGDVHYLNIITGLPVVVFTGSAGPTHYVPPNPPFDPGPPLTIYGQTLGYLFALELSTLSAFYAVEDQVAGTGFASLVSYGSEVWHYDYSLGFSHAAAPWPAPDTVMTSARWYQYLLDSTLNTEWGQGFNVHPAGHWAFGVDAQLNGGAVADGTDWISVKEKDGTRTRYRHKDLFNEAFRQTRDYDFYSTPFVGEGFWDQGSFRTQGIWVTFR